jgi:hypothetical protein
MIKANSRLDSRKVRLLAVVTAILAFAGISAFVWSAFLNKDTSAGSQDKPVVSSSFSFDASKAPGWRQGPINETSIALFSNDQSCFISIERKSGSFDLAAETTKTQESLAGDGYSVERLDTTTGTIQVDTRATELTFEQLSVGGGGNAGQLYGGQGYGYTQLDEDYLYAQVNCNTSDQLKTAIASVSALAFVKK